MSDKTVYSDGSRPLTELQNIVQQQEGIFGPLKSLRVDEDKNAITLGIEASPNKRAILEVFETSEPPKKDGYSIICTGNCLVLKNLVTVVAYRAIS
jgi:hypothetical protein